MGYLIIIYLVKMKAVLLIAVLLSCACATRVFYVETKNVNSPSAGAGEEFAENLR